MALVLLASQSAARVTSRTEAFVVNTFSTSDQFAPDVASVLEDEFVVVWTSLDQDGGAGGVAGVFGQRWTGSTKIGEEFQVNTFSDGSQFEPSVAANGHDRVAVSWISFDQDGDDHGVFAQRYDASLVPVGPEFQANTYSVGAQNHPDLSVSPDGSVVVAWESRRPDSDGLEIFAQRYTPDGTPAGEEFQVNTLPAKAQRFPKTAHDGAGNFLVVWRGGSTFDAMDEPDGSGAGVFARAYDATGAPSGPEFVVPAYTTYSQFSPAVAGRPEGGFLVAWGGNGLSDMGPTTGGVFSTTVFSDGTRMQEEDTFIGLSVSDTDRWISASVLTNGLCLVAWDQRDETNRPARVAGRLVARNGMTIGEEFTVAENESNSLQDVRVSSYGSTDFVVVWSDIGDESIDGVGSGVGARIFGAFPECGDASSDGKLTTVDALATLKAAVGSAECLECICDVDASEEIAATDALLLLKSAVGQQTTLQCVEC